MLEIAPILRRTFEMMPITTRMSRSSMAQGYRHRGTVPINAAARGFLTIGEHSEWTQRVNNSCSPRPREAIEASTPEEAASVAAMMYCVAPMAPHLKIWAVPLAPQSPLSSLPLAPRPPSLSLIEAHYPLASDQALRTAVSDFGGLQPGGPDMPWVSFRLSKFYEAVDALTADVAYRHTDGNARGLALVTAGHYHSRKLKGTDLNRDIILRCYLTSCGTSSLEVRTDALQVDPHTGFESLVNVCHTSMVALDKETLRPRREAGTVPPLALEKDGDFYAPQAAAAGKGSGGGGGGGVGGVVASPLTASQKQEERAALAQWHNDIRKRRVASSMQLRAKKGSVPPSEQEALELHALHRRAVSEQELPALERPPAPRKISRHTYRASFVVFPEQRNVHGKLFGGFVAAQAFDLAYYGAIFFARGAKVVPMGIDEAVFLQPIAIGDLVTFTARVVHCTANTCRVFVTVEVRDPSDAGRLPTRSNRLIFAFALDDGRTPLVETPSTHDDGAAAARDDAVAVEEEALPAWWILPETYSESLMYFEGKRRSDTEGPTDQDARTILRDTSAAAACAASDRETAPLEK